MSYNPDPHWAIIPDLIVVCPHCKVKPFNYNEVTSVMYEGSYYSPRHIPPSLTFTCGNEECTHCDDDFTVNLEVIINIKDA